MSTAQTILEQLGGNRFAAMTGANTFVGDEQARSLRFKISSRLATNGANMVRVTLEPSDLYRVEFFKLYSFRGQPKLREISRHDGVYFDQLRPLFTEQTGLDTSL
jgi:hypothetical protein